MSASPLRFSYLSTFCITVMTLIAQYIQLSATLPKRRGAIDKLFIDSIVKEFKFAVVIPFIRSQLNAVVAQLAISNIHSPCRLRSNYSAELIFYHNEAKNSSLNNEMGQSLQKFDFVSRCYRAVRVLAAELTSTQNIYPAGSAYMWQKLLLDESPTALRSFGFTHFFLMEADTRPIRANWLDAIINQITQGHPDLNYFSTDWWMLGSIYRGTMPINLHFLHINGNAIYHLSSSFLEYLKTVWEAIPFNSNRTLGYDLDIFNFFFSVDTQDQFQLTKRVWHKFRFSEFIQNCWRTGCSDWEISPSTYIIHGGVKS
ncbi:unnamed protein product [Rotaria socialis]|uniref:Uncharacterized protein n=2 Tax=Rotaria socialis TaxID=392032 RepID=A0A821P6A7_9BILA|nr:unnamed protein product [Rotaria socialis]CAF4515490.1 unnamed protein product [Rotaria socialis]CAF4602976.1 unnamed protein product [Rotaria socialis]CAF4801301.1 unnamed protein product [Rotaria socialis]